MKDEEYFPEDLSRAIQTIKARVSESEEKLAGLKAEEAQKRQGKCVTTIAWQEI